MYENYLNKTKNKLKKINNMGEILENWYNVDVDDESIVKPVDITEQNVELFSELWKEYVDNEFIFGVERTE